LIRQIVRADTVRITLRQEHRLQGHTTYRYYATKQHHFNHNRKSGRPICNTISKILADITTKHCRCNLPLHLLCPLRYQHSSVQANGVILHTLILSKATCIKFAGHIFAADKNRYKGKCPHVDPHIHTTYSTLIKWMCTGKH